MRWAALGLMFVVASACSHAQKADDPPAADDSFWTEVRESRQEIEKTERGPKSRGGELTRSEVVEFLDMGPPYLLQQVPVVPVLQDDRLVGYRLQGFFSADPRFDGVDLASGDVVTAVNGNPLERPEDFFEVWESLRTSSRLQVDVIRENTLMTMTWEIVEETQASAETP